MGVAPKMPWASAVHDALGVALDWTCDAVAQEARDYRTSYEFDGYGYDAR